MEEHDLSKEELQENEPLATEPQKNLNTQTPTKGMMGKLFCAHTSIILSNLGIFTCILGVLLFFTFLIPPLYFVFLLILTLATAGTIFLIIPNFGKWWSLFPTLSEHIGELTPVSFWVLGISIVSSVVSLILILTDKEKKNTGRIASCIVTIVLATIGIIIRALNILGV